MIDTFTREDFETYLENNHSPYQSNGLIDGEYTYMLPLDNQTSITVRSSVRPNSISANVGKDSIRVWLMSNDKPLGIKFRVHRQPGWQDRLNDKIKQLVSWRTIAGDCKNCGRPKGIFKVRKDGENKGRPFAKCKEHNDFTWLDEPIKTNDIYSSEASTSNGQNNNIVQTSPNKNEIPHIEESKPNVQLGNVEAKLHTELDVLQRKQFGLQELLERIKKEVEVNEKETNPSAEEISTGSTKYLDPAPKVKTPNSQQKQAIEAPINSNLRVLAGPGSGKTFVIEHRYNYLVSNGVNPNKIIVCTFGKQSADSMGERILSTCSSANLEQICTIHALCYRLLARWYTDSRWYRWSKPKDWEVENTLKDIIGPIWGEIEKPSANEVLKFINITKGLGLVTDDSYLWFVSALGQQRGALLYEIRSKFDAWLNRNKFVTFADMLFLTEQRLKNDSAWRSLVQNRFSHVIIDESQDTNYQAMRILITISLEPEMNTVYESNDK